MAVDVQLPPPGTPMSEKDGRANAVWRRFFEGMWRRTGGFNDAPAGAQPYDDALTSISGLALVADKAIFATGPDAFATTDLFAFGRSLIGTANAAAARTALGLGTLATAATINNTNWSGAQLTIANGGTGATTAADARTNLGLGTAATTASTDYLLKANNLSDVANAATARTNLGLGALATQASVAAALGNQSANLIYAGPSSGAAAAPAFRSLVVADLPTPPTFSAHRNGTNQTIASGGFSKVQCGTEDWDTGGCYDNATNYRFTPNQAGKYLLSAAAPMNAGAAGGTYIVSIYKNGTEHRRLVQKTFAASETIAPGVSSCVVQANGSTDYFELFIYQDAGVNGTLLGSTLYTSFQGVFVAQ